MSGKDGKDAAGKCEVVSEGKCGAVGRCMCGEKVCVIYASDNAGQIYTRVVQCGTKTGHAREVVLAEVTVHCPALKSELVTNIGSRH
jgi:hypothetical protein